MAFPKRSAGEGNPIRHTVGVEPEDYEDLAESLYNRWAGLQNQLEETKGESELECE